MSTNSDGEFTDTAQVRRALEKCELVIAVTVKHTRITTRWADVLFTSKPAGGEKRRHSNEF